jgi:hypothetical protein
MVQAAKDTHAERARVLTQAVKEVAHRLELKSAELGNVIGTSQPTASRLVNGKYLLAEGSKEWELSAHLVRLYRSLSSMVDGDDNLARTWLRSPNRSFGERLPAEAIKRVDGLLHACEYLDAHRARV